MLYPSFRLFTWLSKLTLLSLYPNFFLRVTALSLRFALNLMT